MLCVVLSQAPSNIAVLLPHIATYGDLLSSESRRMTTDGTADATRLPLILGEP
jgi:hypothetical protein